jgi:glycosyltransferase involved in cell wall biosynthesis
VRITYVVHQFPPRYFTGTEQYAFGVAREMQRRGHDVDVFTLEPEFAESGEALGERDDVHGELPVHRIRFWMWLGRDWQRMDYRHPVVAERFAAHLTRRRPDLVHFFHVRYLGGDLLREVAARGIRSVVHLMDFWFLCPAVILVRRDGALCDGPPDGGLGCIDCVDPELGASLEQRDLRRHVAALAPMAAGLVPPGKGVTSRAMTLRDRPAFLRDCLLRVDRILAPSEFLRRVFARNGVPEQRIAVVPYGIDATRLEQIGEPPPRAAAELMVGFIGTLAPHKGVDVLVDAVRRTPGDLRLSLFGRATDFPEFVARLAARAAGDPRIEFRGPFERDELGRVLAGIDVLVVPSTWYENTPFVVLEAFAAGLPVVATDLGGLSELVTDGVNGELFARGDADDLGRRLARLRAEPERLARYRSRLPSVRTIADNGAELSVIYDMLWNAG